MRNVVLFDEPLVREQLYPLSFIRSIAALRVGITTIAEKWQHFLGANISYLTVDYLQEKYPLILSEDNLFIASHILPNEELTFSILELLPGEALFYYQHLVAFCGKDWESRKHISHKKDYTKPIEIITHPFHIFQQNDSQLRSDIGWYAKNIKGQDISKENLIIGDHPVIIAPGAKVTAAIINAVNGPVFIGENAVVMEGSCIRGPFAMLENSVVKMGTKIYGATTLGPYCIAAGEIKNTMLMGYSNKSHDGYLGDSIIGEWCNLGANTNSSNLKNNVGTIRIWSEATQSYIAAGKKCGLIMGDYSRCGISTMFNTGTVVGVSCNVFGGDFPPKHIPSFSWGGATGWMRYEMEKALRDAAAWMELKGIKMTTKEENILRHIYHNLSLN